MATRQKAGMLEKSASCRRRQSEKDKDNEEESTGFYFLGGGDQNVSVG